ncbi:MAG: hypothetical protein OIF55_18095 [Amphritea sp.]|jgi:hypothetical protein|nr:hypothetical protein [Amphritea sp.]
MQENETLDDNGSDEEFFDTVLEHAEATENANNWTFFLSILGCVGLVGFGVVDFFNSGKLLIFGLTTGISIVAISAAYLLRAYIQNSIHATELLVMIASLNDPHEK